MHVPRHHKFRPTLGQGSEIRVDVYVRKRHVSRIRGVGGSRVDVFVVPARCDVRFPLSISECVSEFDMCRCCRCRCDHFAGDYDGGECGTWSKIRTS